MKTRIPLGAKLLGWLALNLAVLALLLLGLTVAVFGLRWEWVERSPLGDRLRALAESTLSEIRDATGPEREAALASREQSTGFAFMLLDGEGAPIAGADTPLPSELLPKLKHSFPPMFAPPPPAPGPGRPPDLGPRPEGMPAGGPGFHHSFAYFAGYPAPCYIGYRVLLDDPEDGGPTPATLVIVLPTLWSLLSVFNFWILVYAGLTALVVSALIWWPLLRAMSRAIGDMAAATRAFANGRLEVRIQTGRGDELGALADDINRMAERLEILVKAQRRFLSDAAHELGSPLARLQVSAAILERGPEAWSNELAADIREEVQLMASLTEELLVYSRLQTAQRNSALESVSLLATWKRVAEREDRERKISALVPDDILVLSHPMLLERILANLARNTLRYAKGAPASLAAYRQGAKVRLVFRDEGPGIPGELLGELGKPFIRPDLARTREAGGHGLGLAIVKSAVEACEGSIRFSNTDPTGLTVEMTLSSGSL